MDPTSPHGQDPAGRTLAGRYLLEEEVAAGGMGAVWRARDRVLGREVAVKVLHERLAHQPDLLERFRLEAVAAARLSHPNVVRVFDTGIDDGVCFIVMELFHSTTLQTRLADGPLPPAEAASIARGMLQGLAHAHREGIIHRDVKPANVLIDPTGLVKVTDFGIAKAAFATSDLTTTGELLGTARYLAPEQVDSRAVDHRADLYSSGVVLYEALAGRPPFEGRTHIATATMRLTTDPPPPGALRPGIPRALEAATMRALARDPNGRFQTAEEMSAALDRAAPAPRARGAPISSNLPRASRNSAFRSWMAVPLMLVLLAALAVLGFALIAPLFEEQDAGGEAEAGPPASARPFAIDAVTSFDPFGGDGEHEEVLRFAIDGSPDTAWQTEGYNSPDLDKPGVGIVLDLGKERSVGGLRLRTESPGFLFNVYVGDDRTGFDPESDTPVASGEGEEDFTADDGLRVALEPADGRYVLLWITRLVAHDDYRALVNEVDVFPPGD
jgi:tRNA A-37 threonylcarbamoyl transferase component Bud32